MILNKQIPKRLLSYSFLLSFLFNSLTIPKQERLTKQNLEQKINKETQYNLSYLLSSYEHIDEEYIKENICSIKQMYDVLKKSKIILLADIHASSSLHKKMIEIIKNIKTKNLVVGLEMFKSSEQKYINDFLENTITLDELISKTHYDKERVKKLGYYSLLKFLKTNKIPFFGIDMPSSIIKKDKNTLSIYLYNPYDFYKRDLSTTHLIDSFLKNKKNIAVIIGMMHCYQNHLPKLIKKITNINPIIVSPLPQNLNEEDILSKSYKNYKKLKKIGLKENYVVRYKNTFYLNVKITKEEIDYYFNSLKGEK